MQNSHLIFEQLGQLSQTNRAATWAIFGKKRPISACI